VTCVYRPVRRVRRGVVRPAKAFSGLLPNVLNSRLNQTTSGFSSRNLARRRIALAGLSGDQQRTTE
jgi:hypothetical protein